MNFSCRHIALALFPFALLACEVQTPGGVIPGEYLEQAKAVTGDYIGKMENSGSGTLSVRLKGNKLVASYSKSLSNECSARIGELKSIDGGNGSVEEATFALNGGDCLAASHVFLKPLDAKTIRVRVLKSTYTTTHCPSPREIRACEEAVRRRGDDRDCEELSTEYSRRECRKSQQQSSDSCAECSDVSHDTWAYGQFRKR